MKRYGVIVAGGYGTRMNNPVPKQFLLLKGKPVLYYTINTFLKAFKDISLILVLPEDVIPAGEKIIDTWFEGEHIRLTSGGHTRFHSVRNGLKLINEPGIVFVHDAVRCLVSVNLIHRCYAAALEHGSAVPVIDSKDSVRLLTERGNESVNRNRVKLVQTPQAFKTELLFPLLQLDYDERFTDEATAIESLGIRIHLIPGEEDNIKITQPSDLELAGYLLPG